MSKPFFVIVMAKTCPACQQLKRRSWPEVKKQLLKSDDVDLVEIELETTGMKPSEYKYHPQLKRFIGWYPILLMFTGDSWRNREGPLEGIIKDGKIENGMVQTDGKVDFSTNSILGWVEDNLKNHPLFSGNSRGSKRDNIIMTDSGNYNSSRKVPTYGRYIKFKDGKLPREF